MQLPCPNPVCTHVFSRAEVQRASALKCPRCGQEFRLRNEPAAAAPAAPARPMRPMPPLAKPVQAAVPMEPAAKPARQPAAAAIEPAANIDFGPPVSLIRRGPAKPRPPAKARWKKYSLIGGLVVLALGSIITAIWLIPWPEGRRDSGSGDLGRNYIISIRNLKKEDEKAFKVSLADAGSWIPDKEIVDDFRLRDETEETSEAGVHLALRHSEKDVWVAFTARDYGMQLPRPAEMLYQASIRLRKFFGDTLETATKPEPTSLAGRDGFRLRFKGENNNVLHRGEVYMIANQGIGYWVFVGAPTLNVAQQGLDELQAGGQGFAYFTSRKGWTEQPPRKVTFPGIRYPYSVTVVDGIWQKHNAQDFDENSDLYLLGSKGKDNRKNAAAVVLLLPKQENLKEGVKYARKYMETKLKGPMNFAYNSVVINPDGEDAPKESEQGYAGNIGNKPGKIIETKVLLGDDPARYHLLAVVNDPDSALFVVWCDCIWEYRPMWREDFRDLLSAIIIKKGD